MSVFGYSRVSTERQVDDGQSLGAQKRMIEGYVMMLGLQITQQFVERAVSGSKPFSSRPEGFKLMTVAMRGDIVVVPKLDRIFRSAFDALDVLAQLKARGIQLHLIDLGGDVTGDGVSKLMFTIISAVAEAERDRIRERIRDVKRDQRLRGRYLGGIPPYGWAVTCDGMLVTDGQAQSVLKLIRQLHVEGMSLRKISGALGNVGVVLSHVGVKNALRRLNLGAVS